MSPAEFKDWVPIVNLVITIGTLAYAWFTRTGREAVTKVDALQLDHIALVSRVARVEGEMETVPGKDELHKLQIEMTRMNGVMEVLAERIKPIAEQARRAQEAMMGDHK